MRLQMPTSSDSLESAMPPTRESPHLATPSVPRQVVVPGENEGEGDGAGDEDGPSRGDVASVYGTENSTGGDSPERMSISPSSAMVSGPATATLAESSCGLLK